ncbi:hypothetical protein MKW94_009527 [Papaver nudicaule]|uniref:Uncharacterized protein n=1 Tax=Papaver nudicaule TaxID=74823 RepID=A0AA42B1X5_PAPNU|nr:hypothetical protein [Papaver nudicaule]
MHQNKSGKLLQYAGWEANDLHNVKFGSVVLDRPRASSATYFLTLGFANNKQVANTTTSTPSQPPIIDRSGYNKPPQELDSGLAHLPPILPLQRRFVLAKADFGGFEREDGFHRYINHSFLRLEPDGNLKVHTFLTHHPRPKELWDKSYAFFEDTVKQCAFGSKCGTSGYCDEMLCSACPRNGSVGCMINT